MKFKKDISNFLYTILEQGLFSGTNFIVSIVLARYLMPAQYGAFILSFTIFYFLAAIHTALLTEPMTVFVHGKYKDQDINYLSIVFNFHFCFSIIISILLLFISSLFFYSNFVLFQALFCLGLFTTFFLNLWFMRRVCYVFFNPKLSFQGNLINLCITFLIIFFAYKYDHVSIKIAFLALGLGAALSSFFIMLHTKIFFARHITSLNMRRVIYDHFSFGKWNLLNLLSNWFATNSILILIPSFLGLSANAIFAANWNIFRPISLLIQSSSMFFLPTFSVWFNNNCVNKDFFYKIKKIIFLLSFSVFLYTIIILISSNKLFRLLYKDLYVPDLLIIFMLGLSFVFSISISVIVLALKVVGYVHLVNRLWIMALIINVMFFYPAIKFMGLHGAIVILTFSNLLAFCQAIFLLKKIRRPFVL